MPSFTPHFGYLKSDAATQSARDYTAGVGKLARAYPRLIQQAAERDVFLWEALLKVKPNWKRGSQAIGDCVSWGHELVCTMLMAMQHVKGESEWVEEGATEAVYGLRAEIDPRNFANYSDGWYGSSAAKALQEYGIVCRVDYSPETGNPEHDLTSYDGKRAKEWGRYGCGGQRDEGKLDSIAKKFPCKGVTNVSTVSEAAAAIDAGCPVSICSDVGFGDMRRNSDGVCRRSGSWNHCMMLGGVRYKSGEPQFRIFQSWGKSASGPDPGIGSTTGGTQAISDCSWWAVADDIDDILRQEDSFAFSRVEGFALPPWDFTNWLP